ncbi:MAG TPA: SRPBCC family protein [Solirubrobacteraceae bacterium]|jgi:hypothetical protein
MAFTLQPVDEQFFATASTRYSETFAIARPAGEVWRELVSERPLDWCRALSVRWTSERPFAIGTTRQVKVLGGAMKVQEHFFIWEEGRRYAFYITEANTPVFRRVAEDYVVEPDGADRCRFTWSVALEPTIIGRLGGPLNGLLFKSLFADTRRHFHSS